MTADLARLLLIDVMQESDDKSARPLADDSGRSVERERQDAMLDRAARQESWVSRLLRSRRERKGKPPGKTDPGRDA